MAQQQEQDNTTFIVIAMMVGLMGIMMLSAYFEGPLRAFTANVLYAYAFPFAILDYGLGALTGYAPEQWHSSLASLHRWLLGNPTVVTTFVAASSDLTAISVPELGVMMRYALVPWCILITPVGIWWASRFKRLRPDEVYNTPMTVDSVIQEQSKVFPQAAYAAKLDLSTVPVTGAGEITESFEEERKAVEGIKPISGLLIPSVMRDDWRGQGSKELIGLWDWQLKPEVWLESQGINWREAERRALDVQCTEPVSADLCKSVEMAFAQQLTAPWDDDYNTLEPYLRLLCAAFAQLYARDHAKSGRILEDGALLFSRNVKVMSGETATRKTNRDLMNAVIVAEPDLQERIESTLAGREGRALKALGAKHAWRETALTTMYVEGRKSRGILAPAQFTWLKLVDRKLWYILHDATATSWPAESAGALGHWKAEVQYGIPLHTPFVAQAAEALVNEYLDMGEERLKVRRSSKERSMTLDERLELQARLSQQEDAKTRERDMERQAAIDAELAKTESANGQEAASA